MQLKSAPATKTSRSSGVAFNVSAGPGEKQLKKSWKEHFGGDERAEAMAQTLQKLRLAYEEGKKYQTEEIHEESDSSSGVNSDA